MINDTDEVVEENKNNISETSSSSESIVTSEERDRKLPVSRKWLYGVIGTLLIILAVIVCLVKYNVKQHTIEVHQQIVRDSIEQARKDSI